jgi:glucose-1-phosphatase
LTQPKFLYFDLGNVLLTFDVGVICRRMAQVAGIEPAQVMEAVFHNQLQIRYERGEITTRDYYEAFCRETGTRADAEGLNRAACDVFELRASILPVVAQLKQSGYRLGILSNTCEVHWEYFIRRFRVLLEAFDLFALSYEIKAAKPDAAIFRAAANLAGVEPRDIFFTDDIAGHVAGACAAGYDAVQFTSTPQLVADLRQRGLQFNY